MNATDETHPAEPAALLERASPGRLLRQARENMKLSVEDVARDLRLAPTRVEALEADDYRNLPAPTFVRGYLRSYARLVRVSEDEVISAYDVAQKPRVAPIAEAPRPAPSVPRQARAGDKPVRAVTYLLVGLLVVLVFSWWHGRWEIPTAPQPGRTGPEARDQARIPEADGRAPAAEPAATAGAEGAAPETAKAAAPAPGASVPAAVEPAPAAVSAAPERPKAAPDKPKPAPASATAVAPENSVQVSLIFDGESWADVRDARRTRLVYQQFKAGQSVTIAGVPPFKVYLSNAGAVRMRYAGEPYDVSKHRSGLYARFTVGSPNP
jgi:cytoskeleton protein RodZ